MYCLKTMNYNSVLSQNNKFTQKWRIICRETQKINKKKIKFNNATRQMSA